VTGSISAPKEKQTSVASGGDSIPAGQRNSTLTSLAGVVRARGCTEKELSALLEAVNQRCEPPLNADEVRGIAKSIARYMPREQEKQQEAPHWTDLGNAQLLVDLCGTDVRYCHGLGWMAWDGMRFIPDRHAVVMRKAKETVEFIHKAADEYKAKEIQPQRKGGLKVPEKEKSFADKLKEHATRSESKARLEAMPKLVESDKAVRIVSEQLDTDLNALTALNGTIDLHSGTLRDHRREDLITKLAPVEFDLDATCPRWDLFIDRIFDGDEELKCFVQRAVGYSLTGDTSEHCLFLLYGTGANGKSVFLETLCELLGDYAQQTDFTSFLMHRSDGPRNDLAKLRGARFVVANEAGEGRRLDEVVIKQLTGQDTISARFLYKEFFEFRPTFKIFLAANHKPIIRGTDHGIWRRIRLIPFDVVIPPHEQDKQLREKLLAEAPGILAWAIRGCLAWQKEGLRIPQAVEVATNAYREEMDSVGQFLTERCILKPHLRIQSRTLYSIYRGWTEGLDERPLTHKAFSMRLLERGFRNTKSNGKMVWVGIGIPEFPSTQHLVREDGEDRERQEGIPQSLVSVDTAT
jgi:putative DNA primase/helicase